MSSIPTGGKRAKGGAKGGKTGAKGKGGDAPEAHRCFHCQSEGVKRFCSQCHLAWYCGKPCQKKHWKLHKKACVAAVAVDARQATLRRAPRRAAASEGSTSRRA